MDWNELFKKQLRVTEQHKFKLVIIDHNIRWYLEKASDLKIDGRSFEYCLDLQGDEKITGYNNLQYQKIGMWYLWAPRQTIIFYSKDKQVEVTKITCSPLVAKALSKTITDITVWKIDSEYYCPIIDGTTVILTDQYLTIGERTFSNSEKKRNIYTKNLLISTKEEIYKDCYSKTIFYNNDLISIIKNNLSQPTKKRIDKKINYIWKPLKRPDITIWNKRRIHRAILPTILFTVLFTTFILLIIIISIVHSLGHFQPIPNLLNKNPLKLPMVL